MSCKCSYCVKCVDGHIGVVEDPSPLGCDAVSLGK